MGLSESMVICNIAEHYYNYMRVSFPQWAIYRWNPQLPSHTGLSHHAVQLRLLRRPVAVVAYVCISVYTDISCMGVIQRLTGLRQKFDMLSQSVVIRIIYLFPTNPYSFCVCCNNISHFSFDFDTKILSENQPTDKEPFKAWFKSVIY